MYETEKKNFEGFSERKTQYSRLVGAVWSKEKELASLHQKVAVLDKKIQTDVNQANSDMLNSIEPKSQINIPEPKIPILIIAEPHKMHRKVAMKV